MPRRRRNSGDAGQRASPLAPFTITQREIGWWPKNETHAKQEVEMADKQSAKRAPFEPTTADQNPAGVSPPPSAKIPHDEPISITKPSEGSLDKFRSRRSSSIQGVETLLTALPHHNIADAKDWVQLHPNEEEYWSPEYCFVNIPIKGQKRETLHLIDEDLAVRYLPSGRIQRFRLALATKPYDDFFLCHVPSQNLDNSWNDSNLRGCLQAKTLWTQATSRRHEGADGYKIDSAKDKDAFPKPNWPTQKLVQLILATFDGRMIEDEEHPGLLRLIGAKQSIS
jgi:hypothetical protein